MTHTVVLDNEAVQALLSQAHRKHRQALALISVAAGRKRAGTDVRLVLPTTVRVEAGWDRTSASSAPANRLRITDVTLDATLANIAARLRTRNGVSVADAHVGATVQTAPDGPFSVLTSDPDDIRNVSGSRTITVLVL